MFGLQALFIRTSACIPFLGQSRTVCTQACSWAALTGNKGVAKSFMWNLRWCDILPSLMLLWWIYHAINRNRILQFKALSAGNQHISMEGEGSNAWIFSHLLKGERFATCQVYAPTVIPPSHPCPLRLTQFLFSSVSWESWGEHSEQWCAEASWHRTVPPSCPQLHFINMLVAWHLHGGNSTITKIRQSTILSGPHCGVGW